MASRPAIRAARGLSGIDEHLGIRTARTGFARGTPPVIGTRKIVNALLGYPEGIPDRGRLVVARNAFFTGEHRD
jgi:hypothetical protein